MLMGRDYLLEAGYQAVILSKYRQYNIIAKNQCFVQLYLRVRACMLFIRSCDTVDRQENFGDKYFRVFRGSLITLPRNLISMDLINLHRIQ